MKKNLSKRFQEIAKKKWYVQGFNSCLNYIFHGPVSSMVDCHKILGYGYTEKLFIFKKDYLEYCYLEQDLVDVGNNFLKRYEKNNNYFRDLLKKDKVFVDDTQKVMREIDKTDIKNLNKKELLKLYKKFWGTYHRLLSVSHLVEAIPFVVEPLLKKRLEKIIKLDRHDREFRKLFTDLLQPERPSLMNEEHVDLMNIIKKMKQGEDVSELVSAHRKKYFYNQLTYFDGEGLKDDDYLKEIENLIKEGIDVDEQIKEENQRYEKNVEKRKELIQKFNFDSKIVDLIDLSVNVLHWQDDRKKNMLSCVYYMHMLLKEISKKFDIPLDILKRYSPDEINYDMLTDFDMEEGKERVKNFIVYMKRKGDGIVSEFYIKDYFKKFMECYHESLAVQSDIHGMCASTGKVSGIVRICKTKDDLAKFQKGEVLVVTMTRPECVPAMKKAVAIVTDEGGITSHAAIVSRELSIPCVIGTKIATKILKDGDLIEVNANHGIVRKIE